MGGKGFGYWLFFVLLIAAAIVVGIMFLPFLGLLVFAAVLALLFFPLYRRVVAGTGSPSLAAFLMTALMLLVVLVPLVFAGYQVVREAANVYATLRTGAISATFVSFLSHAQAWADRFIPGIRLDPAQLAALAQDGISWIIAHTGAIFVGAGELVFSFILFLFFFYYLLRDGHALVAAFITSSPLSEREGEAAVARISRSVYTAVIGSVLVGIVQGATAWLGYWLLNVPNAALLGGLTALASFVPSVGTSLVLVPVVVYLYFTGAPVAAFALAVWALVAVGLLDNVLRSQLLAGARMHPLTALLAVVGGVSVFGPMGLILGPVAVAVLTAMLDVSPSIIRRSRRVRSR